MAQFTIEIADADVNRVLAAEASAGVTITDPEVV
jgi:hypothetical protein